MKKLLMIIQRREGERVREISAGTTKDLNDGTVKKRIEYHRALGSKS